MLEEELEEFRLALRQYTECACAQPGCLQSVHGVCSVELLLLLLFGSIYYNYVSILYKPVLIWTITNKQKLVSFRGLEVYAIN